MKIEKTNIEDIVVLKLMGNISDGQGIDEIRNETTELLKNGYNKVVLDMEGVPYLNSTGLGEVIRTYTFFKKNKGIVVFVKFPPKVIDLFNVTKLISVINYFDSIEKGIEFIKSQSFPKSK